MALLRSISYCLLERQQYTSFRMKRVVLTNRNIHGLKAITRTQNVTNFNRSLNYIRQYGSLARQCNRQKAQFVGSGLLLRSYSQLTRIFRQRKPLLRYKSNFINGQSSTNSNPLTPKSSDVIRLLSLAKPEKWRLVGTGCL